MSDSDVDDDSYMEGDSNHKTSGSTGRAVTEESGPLSPDGEHTRAPAPVPRVVDDGDATNRLLQPVDATPYRPSSHAALDGGHVAVSKPNAGLELFGVDGAEARLAKWSLDGNSSFRPYSAPVVTNECLPWLRICCCAKQT